MDVDAERYKPQFVGASAPEEEIVRDKNSLFQLQAYIVFDEFMGKYFAGSDDRTIRDLFCKRYWQTLYTPLVPA